MGKNIGFEQDGKGENFVRPVVIIKGFNKNMFFGIPLSTKMKEGKFYYKFQFQKKDELVENIFSIVIMLRKENARQAIRLEVGKEYWQNNKRIGDTICVKLPQDKIFLLDK